MYREKKLQAFRRAVLAGLFVSTAFVLFFSVMLRLA